MERVELVVALPVTGVLGVLASSSLRTAVDAGTLDRVGGHVCPWATWVDAGDLVAMPQPPQQCRAMQDRREMAPCLTPASAMEADLVVVVAGAALAACAVLGFFHCRFCCLFALRLHPRRVP